MGESRYQRQQQVQVLSGDAQERLSASHALVVGLGGLGCPVSQLLVGAGVGRVTLIDGDTVGLSNLHRQLLYTEGDVGKPKAAIAAQRLHLLNSLVDIRYQSDFLTPDNAAQLIEGTTIVIDCADSFLVSYLLSDICQRLATPLVSASVTQTQGYLGVFCGDGQSVSPSLRAAFPAPPTQGASCRAVGVTGPSVAVVGSYQAQEALKVIVRDQTQLLGRLLYLDLWDHRQSILDFRDTPEPDYAPIISRHEVSGDDIVLDVRNEEEVAVSNSSSNSLNIPLTQLEARLDELDGKGRIVCVCSSGQRALNAAHLLVGQGFKNVLVSN